MLCQPPFTPLRFLQEQICLSRPVTCYEKYLIGFNIISHLVAFSPNENWISLDLNWACPTVALSNLFLEKYLR